MGKRLSWIDQAKGLALALVVLGHLGIPYIGQYYTTIHLPLFFFLSGVTFSVKHDFGTFLRGKIKRLIIPYFCLGIPLVLSSIVSRIRDGIVDSGAYWELVFNFFTQTRMYTIWFLTCLFLTSIMLYVLIKIVKDHLGKVLVISLIFSIIGAIYWEMGGIELPWNFDACFVAILFMALGYCVNKKGYLDDKKYFNSWIIFVSASLIYIACVTINGFVIHEKFDMALRHCGAAPLSFLGIISGIYCVAFFLKRFSIGGIIEYFGKNTMVYFAWHQSIILPILFWLYGLLGWFAQDTIFWDACRSVLTFVLIFVLLYPFDLLFRKTRLKFAIGK